MKTGDKRNLKFFITLPTAPLCGLSELCVSLPYFESPLLPEHQNLESVKVGQSSSGFPRSNLLGPTGSGPFSVHIGFLPVFLDDSRAGSTGNLGNGDRGQGDVGESDGLTGDTGCLGSINEDLCCEIISD